MRLSDVAELIEARSAAHAHLQERALEAYEHWCELEGRLRELELEIREGDDAVSEVRLRVERANGSAESLQSKP
jgi:hypothetical protein